jgi:hypothetical protein
MLPIRQVFSDIQSLLTQNEKRSEVGISLGRSSTGTNSKDELSELQLRDAVKISLEPSFHINNQPHSGIDTDGQQVRAKREQHQTSVGPQEPKQALAEQDASRNNHQLPTLPVVLKEQRKLSLAVISIGLCLTSFVLGLVSN